MKKNILAEKEDVLISVLIRHVVPSGLTNLWEADDKLATINHGIVRSHVATAAIAGASVIACSLYEGDEEHYVRIVQKIKKKVYEQLDRKGE